LRILCLLFPEEREFSKQWMKWHSAFRSFSFRQANLPARPGPTNMDHCISETDVLPLQAQAF
jgi:hypothetical protein